MNSLVQGASKRFRGSGEEAAAERDFEGVPLSAAAGPRASGPVEFERSGTVPAQLQARSGQQQQQQQQQEDPFGLDSFRGGGGGAAPEGQRKKNALEGIGRSGFMAAVGGGASRSAADMAAGGGRGSIKFVDATE